MELLVLVSPIIRDLLGSSQPIPDDPHLIIPDVETITLARIRDILHSKSLGKQVELNLHKNSDILIAASSLGIDSKLLTTSNNPEEYSPIPETRNTSFTADEVTNFEGKKVAAKLKEKTSKFAKSEKFRKPVKNVRFNLPDNPHNFQNKSPCKPTNNSVSDVPKIPNSISKFVSDQTEPIGTASTSITELPKVNSNKQKAYSSIITASPKRRAVLDTAESDSVPPKVMKVSNATDNNAATTPGDTSSVRTTPRKSDGINYSLACHYPLPYDETLTCGKSVDTLEKLQNHIAGSHFMFRLKTRYENSSLKCEKCGSSYKESRSYYLHIACKHGILDELLREQGLDVLPCPISNSNGSAMQKKLMTVKNEKIKRNDDGFFSRDDDDSLRQRLLADDDDFMESSKADKAVPNLSPSLEEILSKYKRD